MSATTPKRILFMSLVLILGMTLISVVIAQELKDPEAPIKNLHFQSADVRSVFTFLAEHGGVNVVVAPGVSGTVTIKLNDVKWRTAMEIIGRTYNLAVVDEEAGYIRVLRDEDHRKEVTESERHKKEKRELAELETKIVKIANSTSDDIVLAVKSLLTDRGAATSDSRSNSIIIQEVPANMPRLMGFIAELDKPARQIKISARLLEMFTTDDEEIGIDWTAAGTYTTESGRSYPQSGGVNALRTTDHVAQYHVSALQHGWSVDAVVEAIVQSDRGRIIAHPEITTIDNSPAKIQMGQKVPVKQFDESGNVVIKFEEVGTILTVTPHLTAENRILMELAPERSTYQFDPNGVIINTSNAQTTVIVNNGETAVIGGLTTEDEVESEIGVPILKDIPLLGRLFKYTNVRTETRDLIIFVTPTIVDDEVAMGG